MKALLVLLLLTTGVAHASYVKSPYKITKGGTGVSSQSSSKAVTTDGSGNLVSSSATTATEVGHLSGVTSGIQTQLGTKASTALDNLASTALNVSLLPGADGTLDLGSAALNFQFVFATRIKDAGGFTAIDVTNHTLGAAAGGDLFDFSGANYGAAPVSLGGVGLGMRATDGSGVVTIAPTNSMTDYTIKLPNAQGAASDTLVNDGSGNLSWAPAGAPTYTVADGGDAAYTILAGDAHVRSGTTLTANRAYTLPVCDGANIGERHVVKNLASQTFNVTLTAEATLPDLIDGAATYVLAPGDSASVVCAVAGAWDIQ